MAGVASFFISRIDTLVDSMLDDKLKTVTDATQQALLKSLQGKVAIANGKLTYQRTSKFSAGRGGRHWRPRARRPSGFCGRAPARKIPNYRDVIYVEELIGPDTVNTMPPATIDAFRDHGKLRNSLTENVAGAQR